MDSAVKLENKDGDQNRENEKKISDSNNSTTVKYTKKVRRYPRKNLEIPNLGDRAEKRRAIEQSDSDDETPEERIRRIHTEYKHRYRLRLNAESMFDLGSDTSEIPRKQAKFKGATGDSV